MKENAKGKGASNNNGDFENPDELTPPPTPPSDQTDPATHSGSDNSSGHEGNNGNGDNRTFDITLELGEAYKASNSPGDEGEGDNNDTTLFTDRGFGTGLTKPPERNVIGVLANANGDADNGREHPEVLESGDFFIFKDNDESSRVMPYKDLKDPKGRKTISPFANSNLSENDKHFLNATSRFIEDACKTFNSILFYKIHASAKIIGFLGTLFTIFGCLPYLQPTAAFVATGTLFGFRLAQLGIAGLYYCIIGAYALNFVLGIFSTMGALRSLLDVFGYLKQLFQSIFTLQNYNLGETFQEKIRHYLRGIAQPTHQVQKKLLFAICGLLASIVLINLADTHADYSVLPPWLATALSAIPHYPMLVLMLSGVFPQCYLGVELMFSNPNAWMKWFIDVITLPFKAFYYLPKWLLTQLHILTLDKDAEKAKKFEGLANAVRTRIDATIVNGRQEIVVKMSRNVGNKPKNLEDPKDPKYLEHIKFQQLLYMFSDDYHDNRNPNSQKPKDVMDILGRILEQGNVGSGNDKSSLGRYLHNRYYAKPPAKEPSFLLKSLSMFFSLSTFSVVASLMTVFGYYDDICNGIGKKGQDWFGLEDEGLSAFKYGVGTLVSSPFFMFIVLYVGSCIGEIMSRMLWKTAYSIYTGFNNASSWWKVIPSIISECFHRLRTPSLIGTYSSWLVSLAIGAFSFLSPASALTSLMLNLGLFDLEKSPAWVVALFSIVFFKVALTVITLVWSAFINEAFLEPTLKDMISTLLLKYGFDHWPDEKFPGGKNYNQDRTRTRLLAFIDAVRAQIKNMNSIELMKVVGGFPVLFSYLETEIDTEAETVNAPLSSNETINRSADSLGGSSVSDISEASDNEIETLRSNSYPGVAHDSLANGKSAVPSPEVIPAKKRTENVLRTFFDAHNADEINGIFDPFKVETKANEGSGLLSHPQESFAQEDDNASSDADEENPPSQQTGSYPFYERTLELEPRTAGYINYETRVQLKESMFTKARNSVGCCRKSAVDNGHEMQELGLTRQLKLLYT